MTTTPAETAAYVAASIALGLKSGELKDVLSDFDTAYKHVLSVINKEDNTVTLKSQTFGPRNIPIVNQDEIKSLVTSAQSGTAVTSSFVKGSVVTTPQGITIHSQKLKDVPSGLIDWCRANSVTHVYDNTDAVAENPKRPWYKAVDEKGHDIKVDGKTLSWWNNDKKTKKDTSPMPDAF
jgi:hypothetical protein